MRTRMLAWVCLVAMAAAVGCRTRAKEEAPSQPPVPGAPAWTYQSPNAVAEDNDFYGVGIAERAHIRSLNMQRTTAVQRARMELASQLRTAVEAAFKDYSEAAFTTQMEAGEMDTLVSSVQQSVVDEVLIGSRIREVWINPQNDDYYALVSMGMDDIATRMRQEIAEAERGRLRMDAEEAHKELERIIDRHRQGMR